MSRKLDVEIKQIEKLRADDKEDLRQRFYKKEKELTQKLKVLLFFIINLFLCILDAGTSSV